MLTLKHITQEGADLETARHLFNEYATELGVDLCFQSFDDELKDPLKKYGAPKGSLILALWNGSEVGTVALQEIEHGVCEMKRLYVQAPVRKFGIGDLMVDAILKDAKLLGYQIMKLDTLERLKPAIGLYLKYGFVISTAYYENPLPEVVYMEKQLYS